MEVNMSPWSKRPAIPSSDSKYKKYLYNEKKKEIDKKHLTYNSWSSWV